MKNKILTLAGIALVCAAFSYNLLADGHGMSNKQKAVALLNSIETRDPGPVAYINPNKYIQHNLSVGDGLAGFAEVMKALPKDTTTVKVVRSFEDGPFVFLHSEYNFFGPRVAFDVFRFEDGLIVEHWDNMIEKKPPNPSGRTQTDGPTQSKDHDKTEQNRALVQGFLDTVLFGGQFDKLPQYIDKSFYRQHNPNIGDGLSGLSDAIKTMAERGIRMVYNKTHAVLAEGNFVLTISEGTLADEAVSFYDLFRVESGRIVEHWDVIEPILPESEWKNNNGKFTGLFTP